LSFGAYVTQGVFIDLYPFIQADDAFDLGDYRENVFRAYEIGGNLYGIPVSYYVETLYGKESALSGITKWNMDEFISFVDRYPDSMIFHKPTKTAVLDLCLRANGGNMVDWTTTGNETGFDRNLLVKILEFANRFIDADRYSEERMIMERIEAGDIHLIAGGATAGAQFYLELFGEPVSHIGFPSEKGNGYLVHSSNVVAISSKCQFTDTAWQFIRYLLSDEVQANLIYGYPVKRSAIEPLIEAVKRGGGTAGASGDGYEVSYEVRGATDAEIELFLNLLDTADEIRVFDQLIDAIIKEEAGAYFSGDKSVGEVADIIENRVGMYVKEMR
jgi:ABC-type glycerol-3-phosphate transport system substrate-binding protein